jgi:broad specificity phosphatase PhoE
MIFLVARHGQTNWNILGKMQGWADNDVLNELTEQGIKQAYQLKDQLDTEKIDMIIVSPMKRAKKTAEIIQEGREVPIIFDARLKDRNYGVFSGKQRSEFEYHDFWDCKKNVKYPNGDAEGIEDFFRRIYTFIEECKIKYPHKNILIITHNSVTKIFQCYFNGIPESRHLSGIGLEHGKVAKYIVKQKEDREIDR